MLRPGMKADVIVFDPTTVADRAEYDKPHQYSVGVRDVLVNGKLVLRAGPGDGGASGARTAGARGGKVRHDAGYFDYGRFGNACGEREDRSLAALVAGELCAGATATPDCGARFSRTAGPGAGRGGREADPVSGEARQRFRIRNRGTADYSQSKGAGGAQRGFDSCRAGSHGEFRRERRSYGGRAVIWDRCRQQRDDRILEGVRRRGAGTFAGRRGRTDDFGIRACGERGRPEDAARRRRLHGRRRGQPHAVGQLRYRRRR